MSYRPSGAAAGYLSVAAAALLWASSGVAGKALFAQGIPPLALVQLRVTLAAALLLACFGFARPGLLRIRRRDVAYFAVLGGFAMAAVQATYFYAISKIHIAAAILLQYTSPVWIASFAILFWKEKLTPLKAASLTCALLGAYLVVGAYGLSLAGLDRAGAVAGLVSGACFAAYSLLGERGMHRYSPWTVLCYALVFAAVSLHVLYAPFHYLTAGYTAAQWAGIAYVAVAGTLVPFGLYFVGVNHIRSTRASITAILEPIAAGALAFFLLGEALTRPQAMGGALVLGALVLLNLEQETPELTPASVRARRERAGA
ncbi:MAG: DMT family transporter [Thermodesulfobacteriota bacterium]